MLSRGQSVVLTTVLLASMVCSGSADVFNMGGMRNPTTGQWTGLASLEFVTVGNPGNTGELSGVGVGGRGEDRICGAVTYTYHIGKYEVTAGQYCEFLNKVAGVDTYGLYHTTMWSSTQGCKIERYAGAGTTGDPYQYRVASIWANRPVNYVTFGDACRFANWLHNGQPNGAQNAATTEDGAYALNGATTTAALLAVTRKPKARYVVPNEDEWYKAAYHKNDGVTGNYWDYPTSSDLEPSNVFSTSGTNNACFWNNSYTIGAPYYRTEVGAFAGSPSAYGTFDQGGNVDEWNEALAPGSGRGTRGGFYHHWFGGGRTNDSFMLLGSFRDTSDPSYEGEGFGFRIAEAHVPGDIDGDLHVDVVDLLYLVDAFGSQARSANWNAACDLNADGNVDNTDRQIFLQAYGTVQGQPNYNPACDFNGDGAVNSLDNTILQAANGAYEGDPNYSIACDFNTDGYVDVIDLLVLVENFGA